MKSISIIALITIVVLLIPLIAMQFTSEVNWDKTDFIAAGVLIFATGVLIDLARRKFGKYRIVGILGIIFLFLWLWAELAVGVFTNWGS